jgi:hypothetical protein
MMNNSDKDQINSSRLPSGVSDFNELVKGAYQFADKSLFIKEIINDGAKVILITRPRRFGKTLNLSMLYYFLQLNHPQETNLFEQLAIFQDVTFCQKHQQRYPVIFISFKDVKKSSYQAAYGDIVELIRQLYEHNRYLLAGDLLSASEKQTYNLLLNQEATQANVESAIKQLSLYMTRKFKQTPILLIDEYDTPIQEAYLRGYYLEMIDLMRSILGKALKDNTSLHKAILTGITRVAQESLFSGVNNLEVYSLLREEYGQYFGFSEAEVVKFIGNTGDEVSLQSIKEWYNGYQVGKYTLYNPWSIIGCLKNHGKLGPYWLNTSSNALIHELLASASSIVRQQFEKLLQGVEVEQPLIENLVFPDLRKKTGALWSLLLYAGYLNVSSTERRGHLLMAKISIPNKEIMYGYDEIIEQWFSDTISLESYLSFTQSLSQGDVTTFKLRLSEYLIQTGSYFDFNKNTPEKVFHSFMLGLVVGLKDNYIIQSNQESGLGRFDVIFIPKDKDTKTKINGILLEFKTSKNTKLLPSKAQEALEQIKNQQYTQLFKQHDVTSVLAIGIAFCGKQLELAYETLNI